MYGAEDLIPHPSCDNNSPIDDDLLTVAEDLEFLSFCTLCIELLIEKNQICLP